MRIAARPGTTAIRVRDLGDELGADPTAIYRHFRNKGALMAALVDRLMGMLDERITVNIADWRTSLSNGADIFLALALEYPSVGANVLVARSVCEAELRLVELVLSLFRRAGLRGQELVRHYSAYSGFVFAIAAMASNRQLESVKDVLAEPWVTTGVEVSPQDFPVLSGVWQQVTVSDLAVVFRSGIDVILDAAEAMGQRA